MPDIDNKADQDIAIKGKVSSGNYQADVNSNEELLVHDQHVINELINILNSLGGQSTVADPVQFSAVAPGGKKPKHKEIISSNQEALLLDVEVPANKKWYITAWDGSGQGKGFYQIKDYYDGNATEVLIDSLDVSTGWSIVSGEIFAITVDSSDKQEGTASLKLTCTHRKKNDKGKIEKSYSPVLDLSTVEEVAIWVKGSASGKSFKLELHQGTVHHEFSERLILNGWNRYSFSLNEITAFDKTAIDKIEIEIKSNDTEYSSDEDIWIDYIHSLDGVIDDVIDYFFTDKYIPHQHLFPTAIPIVTGHHVRIYVNNEEGVDKYYEVGFNGREVTV